MIRSRRDYPSVRLDPLATHFKFNPFRHASHEPFVSELTVLCVRRCCRRRAGDRQAALNFYYHIESRKRAIAKL